MLVVHQLLTVCVLFALLLMVPGHLSVFWFSLPVTDLAVGLESLSGAGVGGFGGVDNGHCSVLILVLVS